MVTESEVALLAQDAVMVLAADPDLMGAFLGATGLAVGDLRGAMGSPEFAVAVLDFICERDDRVIALAGAAGVAPERIALVHATVQAGRVARGR